MSHAFSAMPAQLAASDMTPEAFAATSSAAAFAGAAAAGAVAVFDKLAALEVARKLEWDRRRTECQEAADPGESVKSFLASWVECERSIRCGLFALYAAAGMPAAPSPETAAAAAASIPDATTSNLQEPAVVSAAAALNTPTAEHATPSPNSSSSSTTTTTTITLAQSISKLSVTDSSTSIPAAASSPPDAATITIRLDALTAHILNMERSAASASYYLPTYDQKRCALLVASLRAEMEEARKVLIPKRRFAFSKKAARPRADPPATSADSTATQDLTAASAGSYTAGGSSSGADASSSGQQQSRPPDSHQQSTAGQTSTSAGGGPEGHSLLPSSRDIALVQSGRGLMDVADKVIVLSGEQLDGGEFVLLGLQRCSIYLLGRLTMLRMSRLEDCKVFAGPITGPCFVDDAQHCTLVIASYQVRIHRALHSDLYLRVRSKPIIEHSSGLRFAPYCLEDEGVQAQMAAHKLGQDMGLWCEVDDFGWIKVVQSPNWCVMPEEERLVGVTVPVVV